MSGLLAIQSVGGVAPNFVLNVSSSIGVVSGDHVVAPLSGNTTHGSVYRVMSVPDINTINVRDDLVPGGGIYGAPTSGRSAYWTPTTGGMSTDKYNGTPFWGDITERDLLLLEGGLDSSSKSGRLIPSAFSGNPKKATVSFVVPYPTGAQYGVRLSVSTSGNHAFVATYEDNDEDGFVVNLGTNVLSNLVEVSWETELLSE